MLAASYPRRGIRAPTTHSRVRSCSGRAIRVSRSIVTSDRRIANQKSTGRPAAVHAALATRPGFSSGPLYGTLLPLTGLPVVDGVAARPSARPDGMEGSAWSGTRRLGRLALMAGGMSTSLRSTCGVPGRRTARRSWTRAGPMFAWRTGVSVMLFTQHAPKPSGTAPLGFHGIFPAGRLGAQQSEGIAAQRGRRVRPRSAVDMSFCLELPMATMQLPNQRTMIGDSELGAAPGAVVPASLVWPSGRG